jgi:heme-degrading monooxygenase HmoA
MFARVSEVTGPAERIDDGIAEYRDVVIPALKGMDGFNRAYLLIDRDGGKSLSITVWDSAEAMRASDEAADRMRAQVTGNMAAQSTASRYEIAVVEPTG